MATSGGQHDPRQAADIAERLGYMPDAAGLYQDMGVEELLRFFAEAFHLRGAAKRSAVSRGLTSV